MNVSAFDPRASSSFEIKHFDPDTRRPYIYAIQYGTGSVDLLLCSETITMPSALNQSIQLPKQDIGLSRSQSSFPFSTFKFDGIFGLSFPNMAINGTIPPLFHLKNQGIIDRAMFSYWIGEDPTEKSTLGHGGTKSAADTMETIGELMLGGYNSHRIKGDIKVSNSLT
jgi:hypothetical protein